MKRSSQEAGITLVEMLIVLALIGILLAVIVPNLAGFLQRGKDRAYENDRQLAQAAVDAYYTDVKAAHRRKYPTGNGLGSDTPATTAYVNFTHLVSEGYLRGVPESAGPDNPGYVAPGGTYNWYVMANGVITSTPAFNGSYP